MSKLKFYINREPKFDQPWGGGNLVVLGLHNHLEDFGCEIVSDPSQADVIFVMDPRPDGRGLGMDSLYHYHGQKKIIHRVNEIDKKRQNPIGIDPLLRETSKFSDLTIFVSKWMQDSHNEMGWNCENQTVIYNGIDVETFHPRAKEKSDKIRICVHHWSTDPGKGVGLHEWLDSFVRKNSDDFEFTYIGRPNFSPKATKVVEPLWGEDLAEELCKHDIYVNGSKYDPAPNSVIEALACGLSTWVPKNGGGSIELAGKDHVWNNFQHLEEILLAPNYLINGKAITLRGWQDFTYDLVQSIKSIF